ncbi:MAG TPA: dihydropteroate synthase [Vicingaceae bacterium]|nr:dihydropteroate synthase [Vicingaceae bacterium]
MGILNITPDSFFDGGNYLSEERIIEQAKKHLNEGAVILDVGGYSTKPGAAFVSEQEELNRVIPVVELLHRQFPEAIISIDTFRANVAQKAVEKGAAIINDISAGSMDENLLDVVASLNVPYILMHMQGTPETMQQNPQYENVVQEVMQFFYEKIAVLNQKGIKDIILDPGFGFGKTVQHNYQLMQSLEDFKIFEMPILVGISRKSMINKVLDVSPKEALNGTTVLNTIALSKGANMLRVHDVRAAKEAVLIMEQLSKN